MPFVTVYPQHDIDFHSFDPADVISMFPRVGFTVRPGCPHGQKSGVGDGLGVGGECIVLCIAQMDISASKGFENVFDEGKTFLGCTMSD